MATLDEAIDTSPSMSAVAGTDTMSNNPQDALEETGTATAAPGAPSSCTALGHPKLLRSRKTKKSSHKTDSKRHRRRRRLSKDFDADLSNHAKPPATLGSKCCTCDRTLVRSTLSCMNLLAKLLFWCSALASAAAVVWYSYELKKHGYVILIEKVNHFCLIWHVVLSIVGTDLTIHYSTSITLRPFRTTERIHI